MEFGSSHVYAGALEEKVYYSSVPTDNAIRPTASKYDPVAEPSYECIGDYGRRKPNRLYSEPELQNEYDAVADEAERSHAAAWDEIPGNKPPVPHEPVTYDSHKKENASKLADQLRLALKNRENVRHSLTNHTASASEKLPVAPPRTRKTKKNKAGMIKPLAEYDEIEPKTSTQASNVAETAPALLLDFDEPVIEIPLLNPPPNTLMTRKNLLPNAPFDPFDILDSEIPATHEKTQCNISILQPTVVGDIASIIPEKSAVGLSGKQDAHEPLPIWGTTATNNDLCWGKSNPFSKDYASFSNTGSSNTTTPTSNFVNQTSKTSTDAVRSTDSNNNPAVRLYPTLPLNGSSPARLTPTAPALSDTLAKRDAEFLQKQLKDEILNGSEHKQVAEENDTKAENDCEQRLTSLIRPSAPALSESMMRRDEEIRRTLTKRESFKESEYSNADTNIVCVNLGIVGDVTGSRTCTGIPTHCAVCSAITTNDTLEWTCMFCGSTNHSAVPANPRSSQQDITYVLQPSSGLVAHEPLVVFCVDTSGSMCVTSKVDAANGTMFVSRLKALQQAINDQLNLLEVEKPNRRVALITFNSEVQLLGDGSPGQTTTLTEYQLFDFDHLCHVGYNAPMPDVISKTRYQLAKAVCGLQESGSTALGPAMLVSTALASKAPGSQVILCTDGCANVGIGSLEKNEVEYQRCHHFYDQVTNLASSKGVVVSVLSIAGSDCRLVQLGKVADKTAGKVNIVEPGKLSAEFGNVLSDDVLATNVSVDLVTHKHLYFSGEDGVIGSSTGKFVGNITKESAITFRYGIRDEGEFATIAPPANAPFQLKIMYRSLSGDICMRILTQMRPVTENRNLAESEMNPAVIGTYASHSAAQLALQGDLENAREVTNSHKALLGRGMSLRSHTGSIQLPQQQDAIYESVQKRMEDIGQELSQADATSASSTEEQTSDSAPQLAEDRIYGEIVAGSEDQPPALPPRIRGSKESAVSPFKHSSSLESMLSKLSSIPKPAMLKKKKKRNKQKTAMQLEDHTAQKLFSFSNKKL